MSIQGTAPCSYSKAWTERRLHGTIFQWLPLNYVSLWWGGCVHSKMYTAKVKAMHRTIWKKYIWMVISAFESDILAQLQANFTSFNPAAVLTVWCSNENPSGLIWISHLCFLKQPTYFYFYDCTMSFFFHPAATFTEVSDQNLSIILVFHLEMNWWPWCFVCTD